MIKSIKKQEQFTRTTSLKKAANFGLEFLENRRLLSAGQLDATFANAGVISDATFPNASEKQLLPEYQELGLCSQYVNDVVSLSG